jgi:hypothetical protein
MLNKITAYLKANWNAFYPGAVFPARLNSLLLNTLGNVIIFFFKGGEKTPFMEAKIGDDEHYINYCKTEMIFADRIKSSDFPALKTSFPEILYSGAMDGYYVHLRKFIPGRSLQSSMFFGSEHDYGIILKKVVGWITQMHIETSANKQPYDFSEKAYQEHLAWCAAVFESRFTLSAAETSYLDKFKRLAVSSSFAPFTTVVEHGDPSPSNILVDGENIILIDWAHAIFNGFPLHDLINFLIWYSIIVCPSETPASSLTGSLGQKTKNNWISKELVRSIYFERNEYSDSYKKIIAGYCKAMNIDERLIKFLFLTFSMTQPLYCLFQLFVEEENNFIFNE